MLRPAILLPAFALCASALPDPQDPAAQRRVDQIRQSWTEGRALAEKLGYTVIGNSSSGGGAIVTWRGQASTGVAAQGHFAFEEAAGGRKATFAVTGFREDSIPLAFFADWSKAAILDACVSSRLSASWDDYFRQTQALGHMAMEFTLTTSPGACSSSVRWSDRSPLPRPAGAAPDEEPPSSPTATGFFLREVEKGALRRQARVIFTSPADPRPVDLAAFRESLVKSWLAADVLRKAQVPAVAKAWLAAETKALKAGYTVLGYSFTDDNGRLRPGVLWSGKDPSGKPLAGEF
ncbi:MAG: hypothetical protein HZB13_06455 [Acidobacteria bacterium]|nr:hypothetical protein [Acidobacteriota bacterium]